MCLRVWSLNHRVCDKFSVDFRSQYASLYSLSHVWDLVEIQIVANIWYVQLLNFAVGIMWNGIFLWSWIPFSWFEVEHLFISLPKCCDKWAKDSSFRLIQWPTFLLLITPTSWVCPGVCLHMEGTEHHLTHVFVSYIDFMRPNKWWAPKTRILTRDDYKHCLVWNVSFVLCSGPYIWHPF